MSNDTESLTLTDFLLARIAEDEAAARDIASYLEDGAQIKVHLRRQVSANEWMSKDVYPYDPARVLAECVAKRRIVERFQFIADGEGETTELAFHEQGLFEAVTILAAVYADHPDYRDEWLP